MKVGRRKSGAQQSLSKGLRPTHQAVTKEATASNGKTMIRYYARPALFIVSQSDPCPGESVIALPSKPWKKPISLHNPFN